MMIMMKDKGDEYDFCIDGGNRIGNISTINVLTHMMRVRKLIMIRKVIMKMMMLVIRVSFISPLSLQTYADKDWSVD